MDDPRAAAQAKFRGSPRDDQRVFGTIGARPHHGMNMHGKLRILRQPTQFLVQHAQALLRHRIRPHIVDADLHAVEAGGVQFPDAVDGQQIAVRDCHHQHPMAARPPDNRLQFRMKKRFPARQGNGRGAKRRQPIDAAHHFLDGDGLGDVIEFTTVGASQITASCDDKMSEHLMPRRFQSQSHHPDFAVQSVPFAGSAPDCLRGHLIHPGFRDPVGGLPRPDELTG